MYYFGRWGRTVKGKMERLTDNVSAAAEALYDEQKEDLFAGRAPRKRKGDELLLADLCNHSNFGAEAGRRAANLAGVRYPSELCGR